MAVQEMKGGLWPSQSKHPKAPAYQGTFLINGVKHYIAVWHSDGRPVMNFTINAGQQGVRKEQFGLPSAAPPPSTPASYNEPPMDFDDDIPF